MSDTAESEPASPATDKPAKRPSRRRKTAPDPTPSAWFQHGPNWIAAVAALLTAIIAGVGLFFGLQGVIRPEPQPTTPVAEATRHASVQIDALWVGGGGYTLEGTYVDLRPASEKVLVVAQPSAAPGARWAVIDAALEPPPEGEVASGRWNASLPVDPTLRFGVAAIVVPWLDGSGFDAGPIVEIRQHGPEASPVIARTPVEPLDPADLPTHPPSASPDP